MSWLRRVLGLGDEPDLGTPDLVPRWKAFLEAPAAKGEPTIPPAKVPKVKPLLAKKRGQWATWYRRVS